MAKRMRMTPQRRRNERRMWKKLTREGRKAVRQNVQNVKRVETIEIAERSRGAH